MMRLSSLRKIVNTLFKEFMKGYQHKFKFEENLKIRYQKHRFTVTGAFVYDSDQHLHYGGGNRGVGSVGE